MEPFIAAYVPALHPIQLIEPVEFAKYPGLHKGQDDLFALSLADPAAHSLQLVEPFSEEYVPALQPRQLTEPVVFVKYPGLHMGHDV